jgi:regulation of enolase protein 1 (concanavalin A-like superfamily)
MRRCVLLLVILPLAVMSAADGAPKETVQFEEQFTGELSKGWSWVREDPRAWRVNRGELVLRVLPGYLHAERKDAKNVLLRRLPRSSSTLAVEVHVESEPRAEFEHAGLVWYVDDDNYVSLFQEKLGDKVKLQMVTEKDGKPHFAVAGYDAKGVWMRLVVSRGKISTQYRSSEKEEWKLVGQSQAPVVAAASVGVMAGGGPRGGDRHARFRAFRILEIASEK